MKKNKNELDVFTFFMMNTGSMFISATEKEIRIDKRIKRLKQKGGCISTSHTTSDYRVLHSPRG